jgi:glutathione S-transferase
LNFLALPILYSYRRCPYAMRARMALTLAKIAVEIREISLREKPAHMLKVSPKATVPVLILPDGSVIDESLEIMYWAFNHSLNQAREENDALRANIHAPSRASPQRALIETNDTTFKQDLDCYKYPEKNPEKSQQEYRQLGEIFLAQLENLLLQNTYLFGEKPSFADYAIFPFIRQFAAVDSAWFNGENAENAPYPKLRDWLKSLVESELFISIMQKKATFAT